MIKVDNERNFERSNQQMAVLTILAAILATFGHVNISLPFLIATPF